LDVAAFEALFASHGARMKSVAFNLLGNQSDAQDAVQEAFLRAFRNRWLFRSQASVWTWTYRILLNTCHDMARRQAVRRLHSGGDDLMPEMHGPIRDDLLRIALRRAVATLAPIYREVFVLCDVEGYTHREVAEVLEIAEGTSRARLSEARRQLRARLAHAPEAATHDI
jgi:RNA polymerase sigma-70 factor, ECF subfamily